MNYEQSQKIESDPTISEQELINLLDMNGIENEETKRHLLKFVDECHHFANIEAAAVPDSKLVSNRANLNAEMKIAFLYSHTTRYHEEAIEAFWSVYDAASENEETHDIAERCKKAIQALEGTE